MRAIAIENQDIIFAGSRIGIESIKILNIVYSKLIISKSYRRLYKKYILIKLVFEVFL